MKKIILVLLILLFFSFSASSKILILNPADENFVNIGISGNAFGGTYYGSWIEGSVLFSGNDGNIFQNNSNLFWSEGDKRLSIGGNTGLDPRTGLSITGDMDIIHTAIQADDHAFEIDLDAAGFGDVKGIDIDYITGAISLGEDEEVILINIDEFAASGGDVVAVEVLTTEGAATIYGLEAAALVNPVVQLSGIFTDMDSASNGGTDNLTEFVSTLVDVPIFTSDNNFITLGSASKFEEIEFLLDTFASKNIQPTFEFSTGIGTWDDFTPADGTNGLRNTGVIAWFDEDIPTWAVGTGNEYLIRITRTRNNVPTVPIENKVQIAATIKYEWTKGGDLRIRDLNIERNVQIKGDLNVIGDINFGGAFAIEGLSFVDGGMVAIGDSNFVNAGISGNLFCDGNITLGQKIIFPFGEVIDNPTDSWIRVKGNLQVNEEINTLTNLLVNGYTNTVGVYKRDGTSGVTQSAISLTEFGTGFQVDLDTSGGIITLFAIASCPYLYVDDGEYFKWANDVFPERAGEDNESIDFVSVPIKPKDYGYYRFRLKENDPVEEYSYINYVSLTCVDHKQDYKVATSQDGTIYAYKITDELMSATTDTGENVISFVNTPVSEGTSFADSPLNEFYTWWDNNKSIENAESKIASGEVVRQKGDWTAEYLNIDFGSITEKAYLLVSADKCSYSVWVNGRKLDTVELHERWMMNVIELPVDFKGQLRIKREDGNPKISYIALSTDIDNHTETISDLQEVLNNDDFDVRHLVDTDDDERIRLERGDYIDMKFSVPESKGEERDFIFVSKGYYHGISTHRKTGERLRTMK